MTIGNVRSARKDHAITRRVIGHGVEGERGSRTVSGAYALAIQLPPMPDVASYDQWLSQAFPKLPTRRGVPVIDGARLRRWVEMRRRGQSLEACARVGGVTASTVCQWIHRLPRELGGTAA